MIFPTGNTAHLCFKNGFAKHSPSAFFILKERNNKGGGQKST